ncbi:MAG: signal peptidase I [Candidatus Harrisonbacteria bacterium CG10_big_fil_rev_8_21_14_0_10_49_15]|uniref:Signal peptidase I n=1 Tax=Candidatus Harrisonbacteria bacterium CG10_big_fil_rev_8_21_14_0_10_49_15 TaxID=1974587 RepID=A0A2H0UJW3_9BACT|nr:MAG: signal peptidase I [Candidatus Harrisonbacteria bacterium CG10_big_fil_rev_8_21_14_0_10_49_15]
MARSKLKRFLGHLWEIAEIIIIALVTVYIIRTFIAQPFLVSGASMESTFIDGDYLLIDELTYYFREPARGEVVVFRYPLNPKSFFIKRIIGLPGETVQVFNDQIRITPAESGEPFILDEFYLDESTYTSGEQSTELAAGEYFVMGDNRSNSFDSRNWGALDKGEIVGLARLRVFPFTDFGVVRNPSFGN